MFYSMRSLHLMFRIERKCKDTTFFYFCNTFFENGLADRQLKTQNPPYMVALFFVCSSIVLRLFFDRLSKNNRRTIGKQLKMRGAFRHPWSAPGEVSVHMILCRLQDSPFGNLKFLKNILPKGKQFVTLHRKNKECISVHSEGRDNRQSQSLPAKTGIARLAFALNKGDFSTVFFICLLCLRKNFPCNLKP